MFEKIKKNLNINIIEEKDIVRAFNNHYKRLCLDTLPQNFAKEYDQKTSELGLDNNIEDRANFLANRGKLLEFIKEKKDKFKFNDTSEHPSDGYKVKNPYNETKLPSSVEEILNKKIGSFNNLPKKERERILKSAKICITQEELEHAKRFLALTSNY